jgi:hypothetical protein
LSENECTATRSPIRGNTAETLVAASVRNSERRESGAIIEPETSMSNVLPASSGERPRTYIAASSAGPTAEHDARQRGNGTAARVAFIASRAASTSFVHPGLTQIAQITKQRKRTSLFSATKRPRLGLEAPPPAPAAESATSHVSGTARSPDQLLPHAGLRIVTRLT